jgi:FlaA1/EpsC-like NDP-sugar epimerase
MTAMGEPRSAGVSRKSTHRSALDWARSFSLRLAITDFIVIAWAVIGTQIAWFGTLDAELNVSEYRGGFGLNYTLVSVALIVTWAAILTGFGTRDARFIGSGNNEYRRVVDATVRLFGVVAIIAFLFQLDLARGYIILSFPIGLFALLSSRWMWRQWLSAQRLRGKYSSRVILVGSRVSVTAIARDLARAPGSGYLVVGACIPGDLTSCRA